MKTYALYLSLIISFLLILVLACNKEEAIIKGNCAVICNCGRGNTMYYILGESYTKVECRAKAKDYESSSCESCWIEWGEQD